MASFFVYVPAIAQTLNDATYFCQHERQLNDICHTETNLGVTKTLRNVITWTHVASKVKTVQTSKRK